PGVVAVLAAVPHRGDFALCAYSFAHGSSLREYVCRRPADDGVLLAGADWNSARVPRPAPWCRGDSGVCVCSTGSDLSRTRGCTGALERSAFPVRAKALIYRFSGGVCRLQDPAEGRSLFAVGISAAQREGASSVSLNHPLMAR